MLLGLLLYAVTTICSPGAANLLAADGGARVGVRRASGLLIGIAGTVLLIVAVCAAGLGQVVRALPAVQLALRVGGSAYLIWLALSIMRSRRPGEVGSGRPPGFATGVVSTVVNPKTWTVALGAAASFSELASNPLALSALLTAVFAVVVVPNLLLWAILGATVTTRLRTRRSWRVFTGVLGALLLVSVVTIWVG